MSAGRVQSVAVRIIVDRENEIRSFVSQEYWSVDAKLLAASSKKAFPAKLSEVDGEKVSIGSKEEADKLLERLKGAEFIVTGLKKSQRKKQPAPPFTTSTLQQEASRRYSFQSRRTMKAAQELYEGIDVAGMGADLYESYVGSIISTGALATAAGLGFKGIVVPMMIAAIGIIASIIGTFFVSTKEGATQKNLLGSLRRGTYVSAILSAISAAVLIFTLLPQNTGVFWAVISGLVAGVLIGFFTE